MNDGACAGDLVNPDARLNPHAKRVHGLGARFLSTKPAFADIAGAVLDFLGDSPVLAHGAEEDARALLNDLALAGRPGPDASRFVCSARLASLLLGGEAPSLDRLCDLFGVDRTPRARGHSAILDASLLAECQLAMASMPGYGAARGVRLGSDLTSDRASRARDADARRQAAMPVETLLCEEEGTVVFRLRSGESVSTPIPDHPAHSHRAVVLRAGAVGIVPHGGGRPENPLGAAVVAWRGGAPIGFDARGAPVAEGPSSVPEEEGQAPSSPRM